MSSRRLRILARHGFKKEGLKSDSEFQPAAPEARTARATFKHPCANNVHKCKPYFLLRVQLACRLISDPPSHPRTADPKMARNTEKAKLMLNRWTSMKEEMSRGDDRKRDRRPYLASEVKSLPEAERWRMDVVREITKKVSEIQNAGLGEARTRDLNDEINKLIREKGHWERQIKQLGGPDYGRSSGKAFDSDALELPGASRYKYFGAARDLAGVKELFEAAREKEVRRSRGDIMKTITPDYYGFREDEDEGVLRAETAAQAGASSAAASRWEAARFTAAAERMARRAAGVVVPEDAESDEGEGEGEGAEHTHPSRHAAPALNYSSSAGPARPAPAVQLNASQIEAILKERKRQLLLSRYGSSDGV